MTPRRIAPTPAPAPIPACAPVDKPDDSAWLDSVLSSSEVWAVSEAEVVAGVVGVVSAFVGAADVVAAVSLAVVDVELEVVAAAGSGFTTTNWDCVLSQVAHGSGFGGSTSNIPKPVLQQSLAPSQQKDVLVFVTLLQDIKSGPRFGAAFIRRG